MAIRSPAVRSPDDAGAEVDEDFGNVDLDRADLVTRAARDDA